MIKSLGKEVKIYSGENVSKGKLLALKSDSLSYEDKEGKHLLPVSEFSLVVLGEKDATHRIKKERDRIFHKALLYWSISFALGYIPFILLAVVKKHGI